MILDGLVVPWRSCRSLLLLALAHGLLGLPANSQATDQGWQLLGQVGGAIQAVARRDGLAFVGVGPRVVTVDVSVPSAMRELGASTPFAYFVQDISLEGQYAYVAAGPAGLRILDISAPSRPVEVGFWDSPGFANAVAVGGGIVYVADGPFGIRVVDVADPSRPREIAWAFPFNHALDVLLAGHLAFVAAAGDGLLVADMSDPAHPVEMASLALRGFAYGIAGSGTSVLVADGWAGLQVVDVSNPSRPRRTAALDTPGWALDVDISGTRAVVADGVDGLSVVDVTDPARPILSSSTLTGWRARKVCLQGQTALVADEKKGLCAFSLEDPAKPVEVGVFGSGVDARNMALLPPYAYVASGQSGLRIIDVSEPSRPRELSAVTVPGMIYSVAAGGRFVFMQPGSGRGMWVVDVADPENPAVVARFEVPGSEWHDLELVGDLLYVAPGYGLDIVDVSSPTSAKLLSSLSLADGGSSCQVVAVDGTLAFVAAEQQGIAIVDVSNPTSPRSLSFYRPSTPDGFHGVAAANGRLYAGGRNLWIADISDPGAPAELGHVELPDRIWRIAVAGGEAWLADEAGGVQVVDVSDPVHPRILDAYNTPGSTHDVVAGEGAAYLADGPGGLLILRRGSGPVSAPAAGHGGLQPGWRSPRGQPQRDETVADPVLQRPQRHGAATRSSADSLRGGEREAWSNYAAVSGSIATRRAATKNGVTWSVTTTTDSGPGSLRECLARASAGDTIIFDPAVFPPSSPAIIAPRDYLPALSQGGITIDASNAGVILDGRGAATGVWNALTLLSNGNTLMGLQLTGWEGPAIAVTGSGNVIGGDRSVGVGPSGQGNVIGGNGHGIGLSAAASRNRIIGNLIGTDATGRAAQGNRVIGISLQDEASFNTIGGATPGERNVISGNGNLGIKAWLGVVGTTIVGNYIGTDATGTVALGNGGVSFAAGPIGAGVYIEDGPMDTVIGGSGSGEGNVISGNNGIGVFITGPESSQTSVIGNIIGLDAPGTRALPNTSGSVDIQISVFNRIGGSWLAEGNVILGALTSAGSDNVIMGNRIGTDPSGSHPLGAVRSVVGLSCTRNHVGGGSEAQRNILRDGVAIVGPGAEHNWIEGNFIGIGGDGVTPLGHDSVGVGVTDSATSNVVQRNLIAGNGQAGVSLWNGSSSNLLRANHMGVAADGFTAVPNGKADVEILGPDNRIGGDYPGDGNTIAFAPIGVVVNNYPGNTIRGNSIHSHAGLGIDLAGGNDGIRAPVITLVRPNGVVGTTCAACVVDVYSDADDEGRLWEGSTTADGLGGFTFDAPRRLAGPRVTATATDPGGSTSMFSLPQDVPNLVRRRVRSRS